MARILVIDDDAMVGKAIRTMLETSGHTVIVADGGHTALPSIETFAFDLVVVDIIMPHIDGLDVIKMLRDNAPNIPIIAMSGYMSHGSPTDLDFFKLAEKFGADRALQKPFHPRELIAAVDACRAMRGGTSTVA